MKMQTDAWPANSVRVDNQINYPAVYLDNQQQVNQWHPFPGWGSLMDLKAIHEHEIRNCGLLAQIKYYTSNCRLCALYFKQFEVRVD